MLNITSLKPEALYKYCDQEQLPFNTTAELEDLTDVIGQTRAIDAVKFGVSIKQDGYHLFALGSSAIAKHSVVRQFVKQKAITEPTPVDWCYINNFEQANKPSLLRLPAGQGTLLRKDIEKLVEELCSAIPAAFESDEYRTRKAAIHESFKMNQDKALEELKQRAKERGIAVMRTHDGVVFAPLKKGQVMDPEEYEKLPPKEQKHIEKQMKMFRKEFRHLVHQAPQWEKEAREKVKQLNQEVTTFAVGHLIDELRKKYINLLEVVNYLDAMQKDVIDNSAIFLNGQDESEQVFALITQPSERKSSMLLTRYQINLLVDNNETKGAPVIYENNPTYHNLVGKIEHVAHMGSLVTNFGLIRAGALHKANGGYLMLDAYKLLLHPYAWEGLKRALHSMEVRIESLEQMLSLASTVSLEPQPIPLNIKVVLIGERMLYYLLYQLDPEFKELFKVAVDFNEQMERNTDSTLLYAKLIATLGRKEKLTPFDRGAVARIIEQSARMVSDSEKLSTHMKSIVDLMREADYWAKEAGHTIVSASDIEKAICTKINRSSRVQEILQEETERGTILIDTRGEKVGQINGLSVMQLGDFAFGHPTRITATVRLGKGEVIDIEREVKLGGPIHSKGVLILSAFLGSRYASDKPLSLSASLVFEQSYGGVEGDSASSAELYTLLSALANVPIKQSLAVTGSVNQHGQVQAIGGANEKIEGFFDICRTRGLTGEQGVLIPASNVKHLMLRQDVIDAVKEGKFHIYPVETIDQGIEILTGIPAGERDENGNFSEGTINQKVEARLIALAEKRSMLSAATKKENEV
jgi:lon-related putative ATP-dependent protease